MLNHSQAEWSSVTLVDSQSSYFCPLRDSLRWIPWFAHVRGCPGWWGVTKIIRAPIPISNYTYSRAVQPPKHLHSLPIAHESSLILPPRPSGRRPTPRSLPLSSARATALNVFWPPPLQHRWPDARHASAYPGSYIEPYRTHTTLIIPIFSLT